MSQNHDDPLKDTADDHILGLLTRVIRESHSHIEDDDVSRALLLFLVRVSNTWRSIRTLDKYTSDKEGPMVDAGTLLRAMFDAYLQAEYIASDQAMAVERARDYLEFEHVERYRRVQKIAKHDNPFANSLMSSPHRPEGEKLVRREYDRVKARYFTKKSRSSGTPHLRPYWHPGSLATIAESLGKSDEYDILLATYHGCVHSGALAVGRGPTMSREHILDWASTVALRVARPSISHNRIDLDELSIGIMSALCKPYF